MGCKLRAGDGALETTTIELLFAGSPKFAQSTSTQMSRMPVTALRHGGLAIKSDAKLAQCNHKDKVHDPHLSGNEVTAQPSLCGRVAQDVLGILP